MTDRRPKLLAKLEQNPKSVSPEFLETVLGHFGYTRDRQSGSHRIYRNESGEKFSIPYRRPHVRQHYVEEVVARLRTELGTKLEDEGRDGDDQGS